TIDRLRIKSNAPIVAGIAGLALIPFLHHLGFSPLLLIVTGVFMITGIVATLITKQYIPNLNKDLVTATTELTKYKKFHAEWLKFAIPAIILWLGILIWDMLRGEQMSQSETISLFAGLAVGVTLGLIIGLKLRRDQMEAADDLIEQIEDLKRG
ncbi:MAG: YtxH domain-containing protein, partial [Bacteroidales bacterium]|nr:YtxH domain-containing protein [Bacteroidales bacterium]